MEIIEYLCMISFSLASFFIGMWNFSLIQLPSQICLFHSMVKIQKLKQNHLNGNFSHVNLQIYLDSSEFSLEINKNQENFGSDNFNFLSFKSQKFDFERLNTGVISYSSSYDSNSLVCSFTSPIRFNCFLSDPPHLILGRKISKSFQIYPVLISIVLILLTFLWKKC